MMPAGRGGTLGRTCAGPQPGPVMAAGTAVWSGPAVPGASLPRPAVPEPAVPRAGLAEDRRQGQPRPAGQRQGKGKGLWRRGRGCLARPGSLHLAPCPAPEGRSCATRLSRLGRRAWRRKKSADKKQCHFNGLNACLWPCSPMRVQALQNMWLPLFLCLSKLDTRQLHGYLSRAGLPALRHKQGCCSSRRRRIFPACFCTRSLVSEQILPGRTAVLKLCLQRSQTLHSNGS